MGTVYPCSSSVPTTSPSDAWHQSALGKSAESAWSMLLIKGELTADQLAKYTGRHPRTIKRSLDKLWMNGLANPIGAGYWVAEPADYDYLQEIAIEYGTFGAGAQRKVRHHKERVVRANYLIRDQKENWFRRHAQDNAIIDDHCSICKIKQIKG